MPEWAKIKGDESKIKTRTMAGILIVALVALSIGVAAAQYGQGNDTGGAQYADADGDGVCDYIGTCSRPVDADGDGVYDNNYGRGCGYGVCDNSDTNDGSARSYCGQSRGCTR
ncbi:MAG: hypothetical protein GQ566_01770 [Methanosarcinales archaeon]|nr:hypothetical protein [Methanosarcinales archaeon]